MTRVCGLEIRHPAARSRPGISAESNPEWLSCFPAASAICTRRTNAAWCQSEIQ